MKSFNQYYDEVSKNKVQKDAVDAEENTLLLAGPGSGKTRVVSVKAARLHLEERGVACISFGNPTEQRIRNQLLEMGIQEHEHLYVGTVHGFCLKHVLNSFVGIVQSPWTEDLSIASHKYHIPEILKLAKVKLGYTSQFKGLQKIQRMITSGEASYTILGDKLKIVELYEQMMIERGLVDFEMIIRWSIDTIEKYPTVQSYLRHLFEWVIIDEYQDLGGGLYYLTKILIEKAGMKVVAVGDPNQLIFEFNGADIKYLKKLIEMNFNVLRTKLCYRFGEKLIAASAGALGRTDLSYIPARNVVKSPGEVMFRKAKGICTVERMTKFIVCDLISEIRDNHEEDTDIAILYPASGHLSNQIRMDLRHADIRFNDEKTSQLPESPIFDWFRTVADFCIGISQNNHTILNTFSQISTRYKTFLTDAGINIDDQEFTEVEDNLLKALKSSLKYQENAVEWLSFIISKLQIIELLQAAGNKKGDLRDIRETLAISEIFRIHEISNSHENSLNVTLTTIHSSKGREFDCVVLVGIQEGEIPWSGKDNTAFRNRLYVACTRAKKALYIVYADPLKVLKWNSFHKQAASPYIKDIKRSLRVNRFS